MDTPELRYLISEKLFIGGPPGKVLAACIRNGKFNIINFLLEEKRFNIEHVLQTALTLANLPAIKWVHQRDPYMSLLNLDSIFGEIGPAELLAEKGRIDILQYLHETRMYIFDGDDVRSLAFALERGHLQVVRWLCDEIGLSLKRVENFYDISPINLALSTENEELVEWVRGKMN